MKTLERTREIFRIAFNETIPKLKIMFENIRKGPVFGTLYYLSFFLGITGYQMQNFGLRNGINQKEKSEFFS